MPLPLLALSALVQPAPPAKAAGLPLDAKDGQPLLLGPASTAAILDHRKAFREGLAKVRIVPEWKARWRAVRRPLTLVAVFGSWCSDSRAYLPDLLALEAIPNPFVEVHHLGVGRDKALDAKAWPAGCPPQKVLKVPTFFLYEPQPGGGLKLVGSLVEQPPKDHQAMAEALIELLERTGPPED